MSAALQITCSDQALFAQSVFRALMDAQARPGSVHETVVPKDTPSGLHPATAAVALALFDHETPVWLDADLSASGEVTRWLRFNTGAPLTTRPEDCQFVIVSDPRECPPFDAFPLGSAEYPDRAATLILQVRDLESRDVGGSQDNAMLHFAGPGIKGRAGLRATPLPGKFNDRMEANAALFPRGVDLLLAAPTRLAALPRTTRIMGGG